MLIGQAEAMIIVHHHAHLLVALVEVYIRVGRHTQPNVHQRLCHHELYTQYLLIVLILIDDMQTVVAAHLQPTTVVGNLQPIVGIKYCGVQ